MIVIAFSFFTQDTYKTKIHVVLLLVLNCVRFIGGQILFGNNIAATMITTSIQKYLHCYLFNKYQLYLKGRLENEVCMF